MKKITLFLFILSFANTIYAQDYFYIDCPINRDILPSPNIYDTITNFNTKVKSRCYHGLVIPVYDKIEYNRLLNKERITLDSYRIHLVPSMDYTQFIVSSFSRNYCFNKEKDLRPRASVVNENIDSSYPNKYNIIEEVKIQPLFNIYLSEYYKVLNNKQISILETTIINALQKDITNYTDFYKDSVSIDSSVIYMQQVHSFYIDYKNHQNFKYLSKALKKYLDEKSNYYSTPDRKGVKLDNHSIRYTVDSIRYDYTTEAIYSIREQIGFKLPIKLEQFSIKESLNVEKSKISFRYGEILPYSDFGVSIINDFIGVVYLNEKNVTETLWLKKQDLYSFFNDQTIENTIEMILRNKIINQITHENY